MSDVFSSENPPPPYEDLFPEDLPSYEDLFRKKPLIPGGHYIGDVEIDGVIHRDVWFEVYIGHPRNTMWISVLINPPSEC